jgi:phosphinothricin acetyltransferase
MIVRDARAEDLGEILAIWNHYILTTTHNWRLEAMTDEQIASWFSEHGTADRPVLVADDDRRVAGFGALSTFRDSTGYRFTAEDTIYLAPEAQGRGIGSALMEALCERGRAGGLVHVVAMIDGENVHSIAFHEKHGFEHVGVFRDIGDKQGKKLCCVAMQKKLI